MENLNKDNLLEVLCKIIGTVIQSNDETIQLKSEYSEKTIILNINKLFEEYEKCNNLIEVEELSFVSKNYYEVAIKDVSSNLLYRDTKELFSTEDIENKINYNIDTPSYKFILVQLNNLMQYENYEKILLQQFPSRMFLKRRLERFEEKEIDAYTYLTSTYFRNQTIQIHSEKERGFSEFNELLSSYIFQISYNYNSVLVPQKSIQDLFKRRGLLLRHRNKISDAENEFDPPRRKYIGELVSYYQMAMASDSPYLEFISYYHVIEYFFDTVFNDELVKKIREKITLPTFSYKRKKDILDLVKMISKLSNVRNEGLIYNELNALTLTLKKYLNIEDLCNEINNQDINYIDYLKNEKVVFSNGDVVNLNNPDKDCICKELANRIYSTRNALVHSKELENSKYKPFHDDKTLSKEMLLLRLIAEQLIINTSQIL